jgi:hypothetical protein
MVYSKPGLSCSMVDEITLIASTLMSSIQFAKRKSITPTARMKFLLRLGRFFFAPEVLDTYPNS